ncbi:MAG: ribonuclease H-like domain-containing protein [Olpidium bornovanus]|uniref:Ribonuclease H-like domain-containing protein n=1 Tax=Olpidium bornovanus TaxID=278681 RepID=A0A8H7ZXE9_9FUNG|nr:MAG: ribonuclease H-like domain-containing protein [Olpidium bornovanus]
MADKFHVDNEPVESKSTSGSSGFSSNRLKSRLFKKRAQPMTSVEAEINACTLMDQADGDLDILAFWKSHSSKFPTLAKMAKHVHAIPATSAPSERVFSSGHRVLRWNRTRMSPEALEMLVLMKN